MKKLILAVIVASWPWGGLIGPSVAQGQDQI